MLKRKFHFVFTPILILGLAGCNNDADRAMDVGYPDSSNAALNRPNGDQSYVNQVTYREDGLRREGPLSEDRNFLNHRGPLAENYVRHKDKNNHPITSNTTGEISSMSTNQTSKDYPHTKPILTQEAQYKYTPVNYEQENRYSESPYSRSQNNRNTNDNRYARGQNNQAPDNNQYAGLRNNPATGNDPYTGQQQNETGRNETEQQQQTTPLPNTQQQTTGNISQYAQQVVDLTNEQRSRNGLPALQIDTQLSQVAQRKSMDMQQNGYFSHTSPTYGSPFDMMRDFGVSYRTAGENIAQGQRTPQEVVQAWMNSEGHRRNILNSSFTHIGIGYEANGHHWTQMFIQK
jgi:uncharacterized YkwD family protein